MVYLEGQFLRTKAPIYETAARFWTQIFAVTFAVGVATGIVMEFQFGTNWAAYSRYVGDVFGSALAAEGIFAFFLESGFLSILVFGWDRVGPRFHFFATLMVALGSTFSAVWIVVANSWQQTPAGHQIVPMMRDGAPWIVNGIPVMRAEIVDFWAMVFNPSSVDRLVHTLIGCMIAGSFLVMSISSYYLLKHRHEEFARRSFTGALILGAFFSFAQLISGHSNAKMVAEHQPAKLAAFEAHFETGPAGLTIAGIPDAKERKVKLGITLPGMLSFLVYGDPERPVLGLDRFRAEHWPNVLLSFTSYHLMVGIGMFFIGLTLYALIERWRGTLFRRRWLLWVFSGSITLAIAANQLGWISAEVGRQPWVVHPSIERDSQGEPTQDAEGFVAYRANEGLLTRKAVSEALHADQVMTSIVLFGLIYTLLFVVWIVVLNHKIQRGPEALELAIRTTGSGIVSAASQRSEHDGSLSE